MDGLPRIDSEISSRRNPPSDPRRRFASDVAARTQPLRSQVQSVEQPWRQCEAERCGASQGTGRDHSTVLHDPFPHFCCRSIQYQRSYRARYAFLAHRTPKNPRSLVGGIGCGRICRKLFGHRRERESQALGFTCAHPDLMAQNGVISQAEQQEHQCISLQAWDFPEIGGHAVLANHRPACQTGWNQQSSRRIVPPFSWLRPISGQSQPSTAGAHPVAHVRLEGPFTPHPEQPPW
jgi:hypothetical protein